MKRTRNSDKHFVFGRARSSGEFQKEFGRTYNGKEKIKAKWKK